MNGPLADRLGRKVSMIVAVVIFIAGSAVQAGAVNIPMLFLGKKGGIPTTSSILNYNLR